MWLEMGMIAALYLLGLHDLIEWSRSPRYSIVALLLFLSYIPRTLKHLVKASTVIVLCFLLDLGIVKRERLKVTLTILGT
jgi:hypothetical protein